MKSPEQSAKGVGPLLGRGSRILGLASVASACGQRVGTGPWYVLSEQWVGPAETVMASFKQQADSVVLESAVRAALSNQPATALPAWIKPLCGRHDLVEWIGERIEKPDFCSIIDVDWSLSLPHERGVAALAVAFCRSRDHLDLLSRDFSPSDQQSMKRLGALANVTARPGVPSVMRNRIRHIADRPEERQNG